MHTRATILFHQTLRSVQKTLNSLNARFATGRGLQPPSLSDAGLCAHWSMWSLGATDQERLHSFWLEVALVPVDAGNVAAAASDAGARFLADEAADSFRSGSGDDSSSFQFSSNSSNSARVLSFSDHSPIAQDKQSSTRRASGPQFRDPSSSLSSPVRAVPVSAESPLSPLLAPVAAAQPTANMHLPLHDPPHSFTTGGAEHSVASLTSTTSSMVSTGWHAGSIEPVRMHGGTGGRLPLARQLVKEFPENGGSLFHAAESGHAGDDASASEDAAVSRSMFPPSTPARDDASQHRHSASHSGNLSAPRPMASSQNPNQYGHTRSHTTRLMSLADSPRQEASYNMYAQFSHPSSHAGSAAASVVGSVSSFAGHSPAPASMAASPFPVASPQPSRIAFNGGRRRPDPPSS
jgi:hypothetical protein